MIGGESGSDIFDLHKHMRSHVVGMSNHSNVCPHPVCETICLTDDEFWKHAVSVHGIAPFGPCKGTGNQKASHIEE